MTLCASCRRTLLTRLPFTTTSAFLPRTTLRSVATVPSTPNAAPSHQPPPPTSQSSPTPATSSSTPGISQPLSSPTHAPQNTLPAAVADLQQQQAPPSSSSSSPPSATKRLPSALAGGSEIKGLNYIKGAEPMLAKEDDEYPEWLWGLLTPKTTGMDGQLTKTDLSEMTKKQRIKYEKKQEKIRRSLPQQIPLHEQSVDLTPPGADAEESLRKRQELTKSQREARRKGIRERNFLGSM